MIKMVVFDMAGTTVDENNIVYKTIQKALNNAGFNVSLNEVLIHGAGKEKLQAIKAILNAYSPTNDDKLIGSIFNNFNVLLKEAYDAAEIMPQHSATELFNALKQRNIRVVLNTGYNAKTAHTLLQKLGWKKGVEFDGLVTASDVVHCRPNPAMIVLAMEQFGIHHANEVVKVGDSIVDIEEGKNARCILNIGITTGAHTFEQLQSANPDYIIDNLMDLLPIIMLS